MSRKHKPNGQDEPFVIRPLSMLESTAFRQLPPAAHQILARLEIEHMRQRGQLNGRLAVSYRQFADYGAGAFKRIAAAITTAERLGFIEVTQRGNWNRGKGTPSRYRLTYLPTANSPPTNDWCHRFRNESMHRFRNESMQG